MSGKRLTGEPFEKMQETGYNMAFVGFIGDVAERSKAARC